MFWATDFHHGMTHQQNFFKIRVTWKVESRSDKKVEGDAYEKSLSHNLKIGGFVDDIRNHALTLIFKFLKLHVGWKVGVGVWS